MMNLKVFPSVLLGFGAVAWLAATMPGCSQHDHDHDDDHEPGIGHHIPDHRPGDVAVAVRQIRRRISELNWTPPADARESAQRHIHELADILRWLPELAADSDMGEREWDELNGLAHRLERWLDTGKVGAGGRSSSSLVATASIEAALDRLEELAAPHASRPAAEVELAGDEP